MDAIRFGRAIRALRRRRRLTQRDLGARAAASDTLISGIELGRIGSVGYATLLRVARCLGAELELNLRWRGEALDRLLDEDHARVVDLIVALLRGAGWETIVEASFALAGERGSIDVLARHAATDSVAVVEVKSVIPDVQATIFTLDRKVRVAPVVAKERGWACERVARILVVAEGRTARRRIERHAATFDAAFPIRYREALAWIRHPVGAAPSALVFLSVPRMRRRRASSSSDSAHAGTRRGDVKRTADTVTHLARDAGAGPSDSASAGIWRHVGAPAAAVARASPPRSACRGK
jgi:transcriptional regulator with XRE-family HTH domain